MRTSLQNLSSSHGETMVVFQGSTFSRVNVKLPPHEKKSLDHLQTDFPVPVVSMHAHDAHYNMHTMIITGNQNISS